jgi:hypothetical protein
MATVYRRHGVTTPAEMKAPAMEAGAFPRRDEFKAVLGASFLVVRSCYLVLIWWWGKGIWPWKSQAVAWRRREVTVEVKEQPWGCIAN